MRRIFITLSLLLVIMCAFAATETHIRHNDDVYSRGLFCNRKSVSYGSGFKPLSMNSVAPMQSAPVVALASVPHGTFHVSAISAVGQRTLPVIGSNGGDGLSSAPFARVPRPDDGNGGHPDVDQPLGGSLWVLLIMAAAYVLTNAAGKIRKTKDA